MKASISKTGNKTKKVFKGIALLSMSVIFITSCNKDDNYSGSQPPQNQQPTVLSAAGDSASVVGSLNQFRSLLGDSLNTTPGKTTGRREVNWDAVPPTFTNNNLFPFDFFNSTNAADPAGRKRGLVLTNTGTSFRVDTTDFADIDASYANQFEAFSRKRLFTYLGNNVTEVTFKVPGTSTDAFVKGFGTIFNDVDDANSTTMQFFSGAESLGTYKVPSKLGNASFSFLGVKFKDEKITRVVITSGNGVLANGVKDVTDGGSKDLVVMDDFLYDEPNVNK